MNKEQRRPESDQGLDGAARGKENLPREIDEDKVLLAIPRSAFRAVVEPDTLSQRNSLSIVGIPPRIYLETLRRSDFDVPITRLGKLRLVDRTSFVAWLRARAVSKPALVPANDAPELDDVSSAMVAAGGRPQ
jgi:hypothetical protein